MNKGNSRWLPVLCVIAICILTAAADAGLIHRYRFSEAGAVKDSVGNVDGKLVGPAATIADGKLVLKNDDITSSDDKISYVEFASPIIPKSGSVSIVVWFTAKDTGAYSRIFNFGDKESGSGKAFVYFVPRNADDLSRAAITATDAASKTSQDNDRLDDGKPHMVAFVIDGKAGKMHVFIDSKEPKPAEDLGDNTLDKVKPTDNFLGRSSFEGDAGLTGSIDELRVYDDALTLDDAAAAFKAGPDALPPTTQPIAK